MKVLLSIIFTLCCSQAIAITFNTRNACTLTGEVNSRSMSDLKLCIADKVAIRRGRNYPIYIYITSPGGNIYDGLRFITFAKTIKNLHTVTEFAASMAAVIVQGLPGKRYMVDHGVMMFHRASGGFRGQFGEGELEKRLRMWKKVVHNMEKMQSRRIGITLKEYKKRRKDEWWLYSEENVEQNTVDHIEEVKCTRGLIKRKVKRTVRTFIGSYVIEESACPLVH